MPALFDLRQRPIGCPRQRKPPALLGAGGKVAQEEKLEDQLTVTRNRSPALAPAARFDSVPLTVLLTALKLAASVPAVPPEQVLPDTVAFRNTVLAL